ncbi:MAG: hypothetical protein ACLFWH_15620 [Actinomycetota bacterium]
MSSDPNERRKADLGAEKAEVRAMFERLEAKLDAQQAAFHRQLNRLTVVLVLSTVGGILAVGILA